MAKNGRPRIEVDWSLVENLLKIQCTGEEISGVAGFSYDTLERACKREHSKSFADYSEEKRVAGKASLRRAQWKAAQDGNPTMLIWLGKQWLGQVDTHNLKHRISSNEKTVFEVTIPGLDLAKERH